MQRFFLFLWIALLAACAKPHPLDALEPGEHGRVVRIIDGDALVLDTGQSVRLASIEAPARPYKERAGEPFQEEARRMLEDMASHVTAIRNGRELVKQMEVKKQRDNEEYATLTSNV